MVGFSSPFSGENAEDSFDDYGEFVSEHIPTPGTFLADQSVLMARPTSHSTN